MAKLSFRLVMPERELLDTDADMNCNGGIVMQAALPYPKASSPVSSAF